MDRITATAETLMRQAPMSVETYLHEAHTMIDGVYGDGYAEKHPELIAAFIQACASDFQASFLGAVLQDMDIQRVLAEIQDTLQRGAEAVSLELGRLARR